MLHMEWDCKYRGFESGYHMFKDWKEHRSEYKVVNKFEAGICQRRILLPQKRGLQGGTVCEVISPHNSAPCGIFTSKGLSESGDLCQSAPHILASV